MAPPGPQMSGLTSAASSRSPISIATPESAVIASSTEPTSTARAPRTPASRPEMSRPRSIRRAPARSTGGRPTLRSATTSTSSPPAATTMSGPRCGSRTIPSASSTPAGAVAETRTAGPRRFARSRYVAATSAADRTSSTTPRRSDLCSTPGSAVFRTTGYPNFSEAAVASCSPWTTLDATVSTP